MATDDNMRRDDDDDRLPCTCTLACIPQGLTSDQVCRLTFPPERAS